jgi:hypothetical protein
MLAFGFGSDFACPKYLNSPNIRIRLVRYLPEALQLYFGGRACSNRETWRVRQALTYRKIPVFRYGMS